MKQNRERMARKLKIYALRASAFFEKPWSEMKLNADEIAERRRSRLEASEQNLLWCWQHRGFW